MVKTEVLWNLLILESNHELIAKLIHVEKGTPGFGTIVMDPVKGFSEDDRVHNMVLDWLKERDVFILNVVKEIYKLEHALYSKRRRKYYWLCD